MMYLGYHDPEWYAMSSYIESGEKYQALLSSGSFPSNFVPKWR